MPILADDAAGAEQVQRLMPPAGCALLITSQYHFTLPGLISHNLDVLRPKEATKLLLAICNRLNGYAVCLAELCGYLPQALRIVASMLVNDVTTDIEQFLDGWANHSPIEEIDMSLALSYDALDPNTQSTLRQLSIFLVSFDLAAARAVVQGVDDVAEPLSRLVQRSLLIWQEETKRYDFHQLTRAFAAARLDEAEETVVRERHAQYYLNIAETAALMLQGKRQHSELEHLENEHHQLRAALRWAFARKDATLTPLHRSAVAFLVDARLYYRRA